MLKYICLYFYFISPSLELYIYSQLTECTLGAVTSLESTASPVSVEMEVHIQHGSDIVIVEMKIDCVVFFSCKSVFI